MYSKRGESLNQREREMLLEGNGLIKREEILSLFSDRAAMKTLKKERKRDEDDEERKIMKVFTEIERKTFLKNKIKIIKQARVDFFFFL